MQLQQKFVPRDLLVMFMVLAACILFGEVVHNHVHRVNIAMVFLLGVVTVAASCRTLLAVAMPFLAVSAFIVCFVPPAVFREGETDYITSLVTMLVVAILISVLTNRLRRQEQAAREAGIAVETERLRNTLLSSISHDLRTPLSGIAGSASSLMASDQLDEATRKELAGSIYSQAQRLNRLLRNLLDTTRVETGAIKPKKDWQSIEEIVGAVLSQLDKELSGRIVVTEIPEDLPLVLLDDTLIEQLLVNLLDNANKYASLDKAITIWAKAEPDHLLVGVDSGGIILPQDDLDRLFRKFFRGSNSGATYGTGLGLAVCKAIVEMHGGKISAVQKPEALSFQFTLPSIAKVPTTPQDER